MTIAIPTITPRHDSDPAVDLTDYYLVHRAMTVDMRRLAGVAASLASGATAVSRDRSIALRDYLAGVCHEIHNHHQVEDDVVWPVVAAAAGSAAELAELTDDHLELDPLLGRAQTWAGGLVTHPTDWVSADGLAGTLAELSELLDRHVADEERLVFPLLRRYIRVQDYAWLQGRFRRNLAPHMLPFVVPWAVRHATPEELPRILADAGWPLRLLLKIFQSRFAARERLVFG